MENENEYGDYEVEYTLDGETLYTVMVDCDNAEQAENKFTALFNFDEVVNVRKE